MLFINATLSKNQLYKLNNQINKALISSSKMAYSSFANISARHFTIVCTLVSCYHNCRISIYWNHGVMWRNNDMQFGEFLANLSAIIRARL